MQNPQHGSPSRSCALSLALAATICFLGLATIDAKDSEESCTVTLEVLSCSGKAIVEVEVEAEFEVESESRLFKGVTDSEGRAVFEVCADDVGEVLVYLIEGGAPMSSSPSLEKDPFSPHEATVRVRLC